MKRMAMPEAPEDLLEEIEFGYQQSEETFYVAPEAMTDDLSESQNQPRDEVAELESIEAIEVAEADLGSGVLDAVIEPAEPRSLVDRWRYGDEAAAAELFNIYAERLLALARRRISQRLASRVDPGDVVQSVFRTFFGRLKDGQFQFADQDDLGKLLVRITIHKTLQQVAYHKAAKRDPGLEECQGENSQERLVELFAHEPTPVEEVAFVDQLEQFLARLRPQERQILEMRLHGYSNEEIAEQLGIYDRKIRRVIERIRGLAQDEGWWV